MNQLQVEAIIRARIDELKRLEAGERLPRMKVVYQDKRDELEALLLRIFAMGAVTGHDSVVS